MQKLGEGEALAYGVGGRRTSPTMPKATNFQTTSANLQSAVAVVQHVRELLGVRNPSVAVSRGRLGVVIPPC